MCQFTIFSVSENAKREQHQEPESARVPKLGALYHKIDKMAIKKAQPFFEWFDNAIIAVNKIIRAIHVQYLKNPLKTW
jgi:hypothetical protein